MKALHISVQASLKKLRTDYIDILYVHWVSLVINQDLLRLTKRAVGLGHEH